MFSFLKKNRKNIIYITLVIILFVVNFYVIKSKFFSDSEKSEVSSENQISEAVISEAPKKYEPLTLEIFNSPQLKGLKETVNIVVNFQTGNKEPFIK